VTLIGGGLGVVPHPDKKAVEMRLVLAPQSTPEFFPAFRGLLNLPVIWDAA